MTFDELVSRFEKPTKTANGVMVRCPSHEDGSASLSIGQANDGKILLKCFAGCESESVVAALGLNLRDLFPAGRQSVHPARPGLNQEAKAPAPDEKPTIEKVYSYVDALGSEIYQVIRLKPKTFRQRHKRNGEWIWSMEGVERVLYNLPAIARTEVVWIVEGEKDADNLTKLGLCATCNVGGALKWLDGYTESLAGKEVILCGDNDETGRKHIELVFTSIAARAKSVRIVKLPSAFKDVSDFIDGFDNPEVAKVALMDLMQVATPHIGGIRLPVYSMADIEPLYAQQAHRSDSVCLDLGNWLPAFNFKVRPIIPGEMVLIIGDTGTGKTAILQNIAMSSRLKTLMFQLELPQELIYERFFALKARVSCLEIEKEYRSSGSFGKVAVMKQFPNLFLCPESRLTLDQLENIIMRSELKIGEKPVLVLIDYVQLLQGSGSRYEKTSNLAEGLKVLAKVTRTIVVVVSQIARAPSDQAIDLHSGKDSGSLENSAGLVIGAWRVGPSDPELLMLRVLKSTKGGAGLTIPCNFNGDKMTITERSKATD